MSMKFLRKPQVVTKTGLANSTLYAAIARGEFPAQIKLGARASGWLESDVDAWIDAKIAASHAAKSRITKGV
jgi:prophage regulatory protein